MFKNAGDVFVIFAAAIISLIFFTCLGSDTAQAVSPAESVKLKALAEEGDAESQIARGDIYREGNGVGQDYDEAVKWYNKAADQGMPGTVQTWRDVSCRRGC